VAVVGWPRVIRAADINGARFAMEQSENQCLERSKSTAGKGEISERLLRPSQDGQEFRSADGKSVTRPRSYSTVSAFRICFRDASRVAGEHQISSSSKASV
jgi:hypothetical protein